MANTDIFNPNTGFNETLGFNPNWNYGSPRAPGANWVTSEPRLGSFPSRQVGNAGHTWTMTFLNRPIEQVRYIKGFFEQFQQGFFTIVDWDDAGRHYVGRFTEYKDDTHTANLKYTVQVTFKEIPRSPMLVYPSNFANDGHLLNVLDDSLNPRPAAMVGSWAAQVSPIAPADLAVVLAGVTYTTPAASVPAFYELLDVTPTAGDWAQVQYVGFGFSMTFRLDSSLGGCSVALDNTTVLSQLNLANGAYLSLTTGATLTVNAASSTYPNGSVTLTFTQVPLDQHWVKIVAAGGAGVIFPQMEYIY